MIPTVANQRKLIALLAVVVAVTVIITATVTLLILAAPNVAQRGQAIVTVVNTQSTTISMLLTVSVPNRGEILLACSGGGSLSSHCQYVSDIAPGHSISYTVSLATEFLQYRFEAGYAGGQSITKELSIRPGESIPVQLVL